MTKLEKWQIKYPDTLSVKATHKKGLKLQGVRDLADLFYGKDSTILESTTKGEKTLLFVSKDAFSAGVKDSNIKIS